MWDPQSLYSNATYLVSLDPVSPWLNWLKLPVRYNKVNSQNPFIPSAEAVRSTDVVSFIRIKVTERVQSKTMDTLVTLNLKPNLLIIRPT